MPRAMWTGAISFGLVTVPVRMYAAVSEHKLHFHLVHEPDGGRIGYEKVCKAEGRPVPDEEIVKAFTHQDEDVVLKDEDFAAAAAEDHKLIEILDFVDYQEIDPVFFERSYYLGPDKGGAKAYALLARAMARADRAAVAKLVMRDRQSLAVLRAREGTIVLERMYFADEVRPAGEHAPEGIEIDERELDLADQLIAGLLGPFRPERYEDTYRERLFEIIEARRAGEGGLPPPPPEPEAAPGDLMAQLKASLASAGDGGRAGSAGGGGRKASNGGRRRGDGDGDGTAELRDLSRDELYERAREADIPGRSDMTKDRLIEALSAAE